MFSGQDAAPEMKQTIDDHEKALHNKIAALQAEVDELRAAERRAKKQAGGWCYRYNINPIALSRWERRFFMLDTSSGHGARLLYYRSDADAEPRRTIPLANVVVVDEGTRTPRRQLGRAKTFHIFSLWQQGTLHSSRGPGSGALLRLSCDSEPQALQWLSWLSSHTADRTVVRLREGDGSAEPSPVVNRRGVPSSPSPAAAPAAADADADRGLRRRHTAAAAAAASAGAPEAAAAAAADADDKAKAEGAEPASPKRKRRSTFDPFLFPASRPMHRRAQPSLLSPGEPDSRGVELKGFVNLLMLVLLATNTRLVVENAVKYGWLVSLPFLKPAADLAAQGVPRRTFLEQYVLSGSGFGVGVLVGCTLLSWAIEKAATRRWELRPRSDAKRLDSADVGVMVPSGAIDTMHTLNAAAALLLPCAAVRLSCTMSVSSGVILLLLAVTLHLKLVSWAHVHYDLRLAERESSSCDASDLDARLAKFSAGVQDTERNKHYPNSVSLGALLYFLLAPTLCYQESFPRTPHRRLAYLLSLAARLLLLSAFIVFIAQQYIMPLLLASSPTLDAMDLPGIVYIVLKLSLPVTYVWLAGFYAFFHVWLNLLGELLRFGDRQFYLEWWNTTSFETYWRLWNIPVHSWIARHVYFPFLRLCARRTRIGNAAAKQLAGLVCFFFSGVLHEVIIGLPLRGIRVPLAFVAMMGQVPLIKIFGTLPRSKTGPFAQLGNYIFWFTFCFLGQPAAVLLYYYQAASVGGARTAHCG